MGALLTSEIIKINICGSSPLEKKKTLETRTILVLSRIIQISSQRTADRKRIQNCLKAREARNMWWWININIVLLF